MKRGIDKIVVVVNILPNDWNQMLHVLFVLVLYKQIGTTKSI